MKAESAAAALKAASTGAAAVGFVSMTPLAWAAAFIGAAASFYFDQTARPAGVLKLAGGILAMGLAAACCALGAPHLPWFGIGEAAASMPLDVRCAAFGLVVGVGYRLGVRAAGRRLGVEP